MAIIEETEKILSRILHSSVVGELGAIRHKKETILG